MEVVSCVERRQGDYHLMIQCQVGHRKPMPPWTPKQSKWRPYATVNKQKRATPTQEIAIVVFLIEWNVVCSTTVLPW